jgi:hypothetical protein
MEAETGAKQKARVRALTRPSYQLLEAGFWRLFDKMRREGKSLSEVLAEAEREAEQSEGG